MAKTERVNLILPAGEAVYPHLNELNVFKPEKGEEQRNYKTYVRYDDETRAKVEAMLMEAAKKIGHPNPKATPWKEIKVPGGEDGETETVLQAKSGEKRRPTLFDAKNQTIPVSVIVGGGSKIRLDVSVNYYKGFGGGINLYINAVQVLELVEGGEKSRFEETEGFAFEASEHDAPAEQAELDDDADALSF